MNITHLFNDLLIPPLDRAVSFPETHRIAQGVCKYLHFNVSRPLNVLLYQDGIIPEGLE
jgi:hypothetical protein